MKRPWQDYAWITFVTALMIVVTRCSHAGDLQEQVDQQMQLDLKYQPTIVVIDRNQEETLLQTYRGTSLYYLVKAGIIINKVHSGKVPLIKIRW